MKTFRKKIKEKMKDPKFREAYETEKKQLTRIHPPQPDRHINRI